MNFSAFLIPLILMISLMQNDPNDTPKNVLGTELQACCMDPLTGFYRTGSCETGPEDRGIHVVCAIMTADFLNYSLVFFNKSDKFLLQSHLILVSFMLLVAKSEKYLDLQQNFVFASYEIHLPNLLLLLDCFCYSSSAHSTNRLREPADGHGLGVLTV